jgi:hypothetical protein
MEKQNFLKPQEELMEMLNNCLSKQDSTYHRPSIMEAIEVLSKYNFENRLKMKGLLTHTVIDSLQLPYNIAELIVKFDQQIS